MQLLLQLHQLKNKNETLSQKFRGLINKFHHVKDINPGEEELKRIIIKIYQLHQEEMRLIENEGKK